MEAAPYPLDRKPWEIWTMRSWGGVILAAAAGRGHKHARAHRSHHSLVTSFIDHFLNTLLRCTEYLNVLVDVGGFFKTSNYLSNLPPSAPFWINWLVWLYKTFLFLLPQNFVVWHGKQLMQLIFILRTRSPLGLPGQPLTYLSPHLHFYSHATFVISVPVTVPEDTNM